MPPSPVAAVAAAALLIITNCTLLYEVAVRLRPHRSAR